MRLDASGAFLGFLGKVFEADWQVVMSLLDIAKEDLKKILNTDDFGQSAIFKGQELVVILNREFMATLDAENYEVEAVVAKADVEGISHADTIEIENDNGDLITYNVVVIREGDAGIITLGLSKA
jgi:hypothetical protein